MERKFHLKNAYVSIYESIKIFHVNHKLITKLLFSENRGFHNRYSDLSIKLRAFKKEIEYDTKLVALRNKAGAHYDQGVLIYLESLSLVNQLGTIKTVKYFGDILDELISILADLVDKIHSKLT